jgi:hypothetical protein
VAPGLRSGGIEIMFLDRAHDGRGIEIVNRHAKGGIVPDQSDQASLWEEDRVPF